MDKIKLGIIISLTLIALSFNVSAAENDYIVFSINPPTNLKFVDNDNGNLNISVDISAWYFPLHRSVIYNTSIFNIKDIKFDLLHDNAIRNKINNRIIQKGNSVGYNVTKIITLNYSIYNI